MVVNNSHHNDHNHIETGGNKEGDFDNDHDHTTDEDVIEDQHQSVQPHQPVQPEQHVHAEQPDRKNQFNVCEDQVVNRAI